MCIGVFVEPEKILKSHFSDRFTFLNIRSRTSRRIYGLALPLFSPETLTSSSKSKNIKSTTTVASPFADQTTSWENVRSST